MKYGAAGWSFCLAMSLSMAAVPMCLGAGTITGLVWRVGGPLAGVWVDAVTPAGNWVDSGYTDENGAYQIPDLSNGTYYVRTYVGESIFIDEWFDDIPAVGWAIPSNASPVTVSSGSTNTVNFTLAAGGNMAGKVTTQGGAALSNVWVDAYASEGVWWRSGVTASNGVYVLYGLPAGPYYLRTDAVGLNYVDEWYNDVPVAGADIPADADPVVVVVSQTIANIDFTLQPGAAIGGRVLTPPATPLPDIWVDLYNAGSVWIDSSLTDTQGTYRLTGLAAGTYYLRTYAGGYNYADEWYDNVPALGWDLPTNATPVITAAGGVHTNVHFSLAVGSVISGTVTSDLGEALADVRLDAFIDSGAWVNSGWTDTNGVFNVFNLPAGTYYVRTDSGLNLIDEWYDDIPAVGSEIPVGAVPVALTAGAVRAGVNFGLAAGGGISGAVTDTNTLPIGGLFMDAYNSATDLVKSAQTAADGGYEILGLPVPGPYFLRTYDGSRSYADEWFDDLPAVGSRLPAAATPVAVSTGGVAFGIDFALAPGGTITGRVTDVFPSPLAGLDVHAYNGNYELARDARTAYDGAYAIKGLPAGAFYVRTVSGTMNYADEWYDNLPAVGSTIPPGASSVTVYAGVATGPVNFVLATGGTISGHVINALSQPIAGAGIDLYDPLTNWVKSAQTATSGAFAVAGLPGGDFHVRTFAADMGYADEWYDDLPAPLYGMPAGAAAVNVPTGGIAAPIDFELARAGNISGKISDEAGSAITGIVVDAFATGGEWFGVTVSGGAGRYTLAGLGPGSYFLRTFSGNLGFQDEWYKDAPIAGEGIPPDAWGVPVVSDGTTTGTDFSLAFEVVGAGHDGGVFWMFWQAVSGTVYRIECSSNLAAWTRAPDGTNAAQQSSRTGTAQNLLLYEDLSSPNTIFYYRAGGGP